MELRRVVGVIVRTTTATPLKPFANGLSQHAFPLFQRRIVVRGLPRSCIHSPSRCTFTTSIHRNAQATAREKEKDDHNSVSIPKSPTERIPLLRQRDADVRKEPSNQQPRKPYTSTPPPRIRPPTAMTRPTNTVATSRNRPPKAPKETPLSFMADHKGNPSNLIDRKPDSGDNSNERPNKPFPRPIDFGSELDFLPAVPQTGPVNPPKTSIEELFRNLPFESESYRPGDDKFLHLSDVDAMRVASPPIPLRGKSFEEYNQYLEKVLTGPSFRLSPALGRTAVVDTESGVDQARAFRLVDQKCAQNKVRTDVRMQRFHERPGLKRKRLASVRYRKRFKEAFQAVVRRVGALRRQGW